MVAHPSGTNDSTADALSAVVEESARHILLAVEVGADRNGQAYHILTPPGDNFIHGQRLACVALASRGLGEGYAYYLTSSNPGAQEWPECRADEILSKDEALDLLRAHKRRIAGQEFAPSGRCDVCVHGVPLADYCGECGS